MNTIKNKYYKKHLVYDSYLQNITRDGPDDRTGVGSSDDRSYGKSGRIRHQGG